MQSRQSIDSNIHKKHDQKDILMKGIYLFKKTQKSSSRKRWSKELMWFSFIKTTGW